MTKRKVAFLCVVIAAIALFTLPRGEGTAIRPWHWCFICGQSGTADVVLNILLFLPLGSALALVRFSPVATLAATAGYSLLIELMQLHVPGRTPTLADLLSNSFGGLLGYLVVRNLGVLMHPAPRTARKLALWYAVALMLAFALTAFLFAPSYPKEQYIVEFAARSQYLEMYRGARVISATLDGEALQPSAIGDVEFPLRPLPDPHRVRDRLLHGGDLELRAIAGRPTADLAPLFALYYEPSHFPEIFLVGADRSDLALRYRMRATDLHFDHPHLHIPRVLAVPGDSLLLDVRRASNGFVVGHNGHTSRTGFTVADGWQLLHYPSTLTMGQRMLIGLFATFLLTVPLAYWSRRGRYQGIVVVVALSLVVVSQYGNLLEPTSAQWSSAILGYVAGWYGAMRPTVRRSHIVARARQGDAQPALAQTRFLQ